MFCESPKMLPTITEIWQLYFNGLLQLGVCAVYLCAVQTEMHLTLQVKINSQSIYCHIFNIFEGHVRKHLNPLN